jgi:hypothetical protein
MTTPDIRAALERLVKCRAAEWYDALAAARAALALPEPPDAGEVAELVAWLWSMRELAGECNPDEQCRYARAADLLERLASPACVI